MHRPAANPEQAVAEDAAQLAGAVRRNGVEWAIAHVVGMYQRDAVAAAVCLLGGRARASWSRAKLEAALREAATLPERPAIPGVAASFEPVSVGDGFGGVGRTLFCAREGIGGPCWGKAEWCETRDLLTGRAAKVLCQGHRGARYRREAA